MGLDLDGIRATSRRDARLCIPTIGVGGQRSVDGRNSVVDSFSVNFLSTVARTGAQSLGLNTNG